MFLTALRDLAREGPVLVAVDDVQWMDPASAAILAFAARRLRSEMVRLLLTLRVGAGSSSPMLDAIPAAERFAIGPLGEDDVAVVLASRLRNPLAPPLVEAIHARSAGNPFYALELARALERIPRPAAGEDLPLPPSLHELVRDRLAALPAAAAEAALAVALIGDARLGVLARVADRGVVYWTGVDWSGRLCDGRPTMPDPEGGCTRILIVANRTAAAQRLLDAVERRAAWGLCTFTLLVPDVEHHRDADWTLDTGRRMLSRAAGTAVAGLAGGPDPLVAVREAVATGSYDEIIISTLPRGVSKWLRRDLVRRVQRLGLPVTAIVPGDRPRRSLDDFAMDSLDLNREAFHTASRGSGPEPQHRRDD